MRNLPLAYRRLLAVYGAVSVLLWIVPLLSILHAESSAVVATVAFFGAGVSTRSLLRADYGVRRTLLLEEAALLVPLVLLTASLLWRPNCGYAQGLMFYLLFPVLTVPFAVGLMALLHALNARRPILLFSLVGILLILIPPIYDIGFHPQFYTYNHVFGGLLGPVYEDQLAVRPGLFSFRALTLIWAGFFLSVSGYLSGRIPVHPSAFLGVMIACCYAFAADLGMITTAEKLQDELGAVRHTSHFDIYYDPDYLTADELDLIAEDHEFRYDMLEQRLHVVIGSRIQSYIYPDPDTKARLTGARRTNVAPVWLRRPQTHVLYARYGQVFTHELAHVFSREFGLPLLNASISVGLVEGVAVALEPPDGGPTPREQVSAAILSDGSALEALARSRDLSQAIAARLSPLGFWTDRGAVSYTAMGSFVQFLIETYGIERFKRAYAWADFDSVYGKSAEELAREWSAFVVDLPAVSPSAHDLVSARFAMPSLFEKDCPHYVPPHRRAVERARSALLRGDTLRAEDEVQDALRYRPDYLPALEMWSGLRIDRRDGRSVLARMDTTMLDTLSAPLYMYVGDARALVGDYAEARLLYDAALSRLPSHAHESRSRVLLRRAAISDSLQSPDALHALAALRHVREERYEQAFALMRTTSRADLKGSVPVLGGELVRRRLVWLAHLAYRSKRLEDASAYADSAALAYAAVGAFNEAAVHEDLRKRVEWTAEREFEQIAGRAGQAAFRRRAAKGPPAMRDVAAEGLWIQYRK